MDDHINPSQRNYTPAETVNPLHRRPQSGADLCCAIHGAVQRNVGPEGVFPQYVYWRRSSTLVCYQETMTTPGGVLVARALELIYGGHDVSQLVFGVDVTEPKHLPHGAGVILGFWSHGTWKVGVIHYRYQPRIVTPIDWQHQSSINYMHDLITLYDRKRRLGRPAMARRLGPFKVE